MLHEIFVAVLLLIVVAVIVAILNLPGLILGVAAALVLIWFAYALIIERRGGRRL